MPESLQEIVPNPWPMPPHDPLQPPPLPPKTKWRTKKTLTLPPPQTMMTMMRLQAQTNDQSNSKR